MAGPYPKKKNLDKKDRLNNGDNLDKLGQFGRIE